MSNARDLTALSESFSEMVHRYAVYIETAGKEFADEIGKRVAQRPVEFPPGFKDALLDQLAFLGDAMAPATMAKVDESKEKVIAYFLQRFGERARRLKMAALSAGEDVRESKLRLVTARITFDQIVYNPFAWQGSIVQAWISTSTIRVTPALDNFVVYAPVGTSPPKETPSFRINKFRTR